MSSGRVALGPTEFSARQNKAWRFCLKPCVCMDVKWEGERGREREREGEMGRGRGGGREGEKKRKKRERREGESLTWKQQQ